MPEHAFRLLRCEVEFPSIVQSEHNSTPLRHQDAVSPLQLLESALFESVTPMSRLQSLTGDDVATG